MRVLIADDHSIVRSGLAHLVAELAETVDVRVAVNYQQVVELLDSGDDLDLAIMDLRMPGVAGLDDVAQVAKRLAPVPLVVFSMVDHPDEMRAVLGRGVRAFIPKSTDDVLVLNILRLVLAGGSYVPPVLGFGSPQLDAEVTDRSAVLAGLTRRQREVLDHLVQGLSNQKIGERLGLNLSTVKTHVTGVLKALGVDSRTQAVLLVKESEQDRLS